MKIDHLRRALALTAALLAIGCITGRGMRTSDSSLNDWPAVLAAATADAAEHRYAEADRTLANFAARYPETTEGRETLYWRALFRLDPANREVSPAMAATWLENYLRSDAAVGHRVEAETLRRLIAARADSSAAQAVAGAAAPANPGAAGASAADLKAKDEEIKKLRDDLAKANEELERIKRRLSAPTKP